jgi:hypothetical protein
MLRRALISLVAALVVLAAPAAAGAAGAESGIELARGSGRAVLTLRGAVLGAVERGRLTITILPGRIAPDVFVQGYEWQRTVNGRTTVYGGGGLRFRVFRGSWRVRLQGAGINASAVGLGTVGLGGRGRYSIAGAPYQPWPSEYLVIRLGAQGRG